MPYEVTVKNVAPQTVLLLRTTATLSTIGEVLGAGFGEVAGHVGRSGGQFAGPPFVVYPDMPDQERKSALEICMPIAGAVPETERLKVVEMPAATVATTVHRGPYGEIGPAYQALSGWIEQHGHRIAGAPREVYLNDPQQVAEADLLTEIHWPIALAAS